MIEEILKWYYERSKYSAHYVCPVCTSSWVENEFHYSDCWISKLLEHKINSKKEYAIRFVGDCTCRKVTTIGHMVVVAGEDDCKVHGFSEQ